MTEIALVAIGGGIGATARYLISLLAADRFGVSFPYGTLIVNLVGCLIIGAFMTAATERFVASPHWRLFVTVGFTGGLTTFSSFSYETFSLLGEGDVFLALSNVLLNMILAFLATWMGIVLIRSM
jgi:CrcB protein